MLFNRYLIAVLSLSFTSVVLSAPTLIARQSSDDKEPIGISVEPMSDKTPSGTTNRAMQSATPTITSEAITSASASASVSASRTVPSSASSSVSAKPTGLHFTNDFPDQLKNGDQIDLEWEGGDGPYILYTILNYPGLSNVNPHVLERSTDKTSYPLTINEDDSHDGSKVTIGIGSNKKSDQYKRKTIPFSK
ncbi:hypothetical protein I203_106730 [Kwoniella mangroviensis CBS 8507]|uniref:uncharacterized protein n=1 Tax=Kwoniella mangroviensis CBS 8507 TaxID=1296122 RepID=UPI00080D6E00|nr:uncharacterized protein I203_07818 [Kwoniella mangroviensis CBS 8507]OCF63082.1 hypothetical protein I203_07818 [Kwoniella mangroviensis CBS 8507]